MIIRRSVIGLAALLVIVLVAAAVAVLFTVRRPLPSTDGEIAIPGLSKTVRVVRNDQGIPDIYASTSADLFMAQGYVQAQDRFFEMDYRRHVTAGRLSELVGENAEALDADQVIRTFGWRRVAEQEWEILDADTKANLTAYADGVNAYLADRTPDEIAVEYMVLGLQVDVVAPEPWDPIDSLAWLKAMAWDLRGNYDDELDRAQAFASIGEVAKVDQLFPGYPETLNQPILDAEAAAANLAATQSGAAGAGGARGTADPLGYDPQDPALASAIDAAAAAVSAVPVLVGEGEGIGSNSWVVSGAFTASGKPILANDPHLALAVPGVWAQVGLHCEAVTADCPFDVSGFSFAGFPGVIIGHNANLAWGITNLGADVTDFFLERVLGKNVQVDGEWVPLTTRQEVIKVNGGADVTLTVRSTKHGPIISNVLPMPEVERSPTELVDGVAVPSEAGYEVSLGWTALTPGRTAEAIFAMNTATNADDIKAAAALFEVPSQNIVFATADGHIGYQAPGSIPIRNAVDGVLPADGTWPRPGWDSAYDWQGYVDPAAMPSVLDPAAGYIVAANQAVAPAGAGPFLTLDWDYGFRSQRIRTLIETKIENHELMTVADMAAIQNDTYNPYAEVLVPFLLAEDVPTSFDRDGQDLLRDWDYRQDADSAPAAYFAAVWSDLLLLTFGDELRDSGLPDGGSRWLEVVRGMLDDPNSAWWDDKSTVNIVETRDEILTQALIRARTDLTIALGKEPAEWQWGQLHQLELEHPVLGGSAVPGIVSGFVNPDPVGLSGGSSIVNATSWDASSGDFKVTAGPSMRMVVDLGEINASTWVVVTGASGHPTSSHYTDQLGKWAAGETYPWVFGSVAVAAAGQDVLTLEPK